MIAVQKPKNVDLEAEIVTMTMNVNQDWFVALTIVNTLILLQAALLIAVSTMVSKIILPSILVCIFPMI